MRYRCHLLSLAVSCVVALVGGAVPVNAGLVLGGFGDVSWTVAGTPSISPRLSVTLNTGGGTLNGLNGMSLGIIITPRTGATGTIEYHDALAPLSNAAFAGYSIGNSSPFTGLTVVDVYDSVNPGSNTLITSAKGIVDLRFTTTGATGLFDIFAYPDFTNYFYVPAGLETGEASFSNISPPSNFLLGTLDIPSGTSAVPEPGMVSLVVATGVVSGLIRRRRKRSHQSARR